MTVEPVAPELFLGLRVERMATPAGHLAYRLHGTRGVVYSLFRNVRNPHLLFVVNRRGAPCALRGQRWFTDRDGTLRVAGVVSAPERDLG
jgi:hypothetical protein